jgi:hypothetical protein
MLPWVFDPFGLRSVWSGASGGRCCVPVAPEGVAFPRWRVPVPFGWPPRGSPSGRWRAVGGAAAFRWPPRGSPFRGGGCRCLSGGPRGGRLLGGGVGPGFPSGGAVGAPRSAWAASRGAGGAPKSSGGAPVGVPPNPRARPARRTPEGVWVCRSRGPARRAPEGGWVCRAVGWALRVSFRGRAVGGSRETRGWLHRLSEEGRRRRLLRWVRLPEGGWAHVGPRWRGGLGGQAPPVRVAAGLRPSEEGRARCVAG